LILIKIELKIKWFMCSYIYVKLRKSLKKIECKNEFQNKKLQFLTLNRINSWSKINFILKEPNISKPILHFFLQEKTYCISFIIIIEIQDEILIWIWKLAWRKTTLTKLWADSLACLRINLTSEITKSEAKNVYSHWLLH